MAIDQFDLQSALTVLARTPDVLRALLAGLGDEWLRATEGPETFSPFDVVGHLIDGEDTDWMTRARVILEAGPDATFAPYDRFRHKARNAGRSLPSLLDEFATLRARNLGDLRALALTEADLDRVANHPAFGPVTLRQLLATWVTHDLDHLAQISRVMAKRQRDAVGPWQRYLSILHDREPHVRRGLGAFALLVRDYDEAIAWFTRALGFVLLEDTPLSDTKRWVRMAPADRKGGAQLLLARAVGPVQEAAVGRQFGGRVGLFLYTDDFARDHARMVAAGVRFVEAPRHEPYGTVVVFEDLYGNRWDFIERRPGT